MIIRERSTSGKKESTKRHKVHHEGKFSCSLQNKRYTI